jgi:hypothetical protein
LCDCVRFHDVLLGDALPFSAAPEVTQLHPGLFSPLNLRCMTGRSRAALRKKKKVLRSDDCEKLQPRLFPFHFEDVFRCARGVLYTRNPSHFDRVRLCESLTVDSDA